MTPNDAGPFAHPAFFYSGEQQFLAGLVPFINDGLGAGEPVAAAVPEPRLRLLRDALGDAADRVELVDMSEVGRNPGRIIVEVLRAFADAHPGRSVRIVGEPVWPGRTCVEYPACVQHEALINSAFSGCAATIVCPYDSKNLRERALIDARATHPLLWQNGLHRASPAYGPDAMFDRYNEPLPEPAGTAAVRVVRDAAELSGVRHFAAHIAGRLGLSAERAGDLELICTELVGNSLVHAGAASRVRIWQSGDQVVFEVSDTGTISDRLVGRRLPDPLQCGGRGLLVVNHLADLVRMHTTPGATTVRAYLDMAARVAGPPPV